MSKKLTLICETCGKIFTKYKCFLKPGTKHVFCSRECAKVHLSKRMSEMNRLLNPTRMQNIENRLAVRNGQLKHNTGNEHSYSKILGQHVHRFLAEEIILGRPLRKGEIVHHKDGNPRNNSLDNLEVLSSQAEHAKEHFNYKTGRWTNYVDKE